MREMILEQEVLASMECGGFRHLTDIYGRRLAMYRITRPARMALNNESPLNAYQKHSENQRLTRSTPTTIDTVLEIQRLLYFPNFPSRRHSIFCNLQSFQEKYLSEHTKLYLVLPHFEAKICITGIVDFQTSKHVGEIALNALNAHLPAGAGYGASIASTALDMVDKRDCFEAVLEELSKRNKSEVDQMLSYWRNSVLIEDECCELDRMVGNEVLIQGMVYYIDLEEYIEI